MEDTDEIIRLPGRAQSTKSRNLPREKAIDYEFVNVDLTKGEQRSEIFLQKNFLGKIRF